LIPPGHHLRASINNGQIGHAREGAAKVYGKILSNKLEHSKQALLPEISPFSTDFLTWQVGKILYGKSAENPEKLNSSESLIENCRLQNDA